MAMANRPVMPEIKDSHARSRWVLSSQVGVREAEAIVIQRGQLMGRAKNRRWEEREKWLGIGWGIDFAPEKAERGSKSNHIEDSQPKPDKGTVYTGEADQDGEADHFS